ncbi:MAG: D-glycerate dehydrogenase, partial [Hyphomonadaceae bacterium]
MPTQRLKVIVTRKLPAPVELRLKELFDAELNTDDHAFTPEELTRAVATADVLVPTVTDKIDGRLLARAGDQLRLIAQFGAGIDNIDVESAIQRGIAVTNTPGVLTDDTADVTMALILSVPRRLIEGVNILQRGGFEGWTPTWMMGRRISGKRLGIIGMGRIGQAVAKRARAFGLQVHYHNRKQVNAQIEDLLEATYWESLDQMLARMDIISVNCPHTPATFHLINSRRLELMKPDSYIINTSRGEVIDEAALARALEDGKIAGAGLDVFEREPAVNPRLKTLPNVVLLPHMG